MSASGTKQMPSLPCCNLSVPSVDGRLQSAEQFPSLYGQVGLLALLPLSLLGSVLTHLEPELAADVAEFGFVSECPRLAFPG